jgi:DNA-binding NarL/FixJ family response regulator
MNTLNSFKNKNFEDNRLNKQTFFLYGPQNVYYNRLASYLTNRTIETYYYSDEFGLAFEKLLAIQPMFAILHLTEDESALIEIIRIIREFSSRTHIIVQLPSANCTSMHFHRLNVSGILAEEASFSEVWRCMIQVIDGYRFVDDNVKRKNQFPIPKSASITAQEQKIITLIRAGVTRNQKIAEHLFVSPHTVKNHKDNLLKKFNLSNVQDLYFIIHQGALTHFV